MKHIKKFEHKNQRHIGKVFIKKPSTKYFYSDLVFQLIFVKDISGFGNYIDVFGKMVEYYQYQNGRDGFFYNDFEGSYSDWSFNEIDFMTVKEFYKIYKDSYIRIFEQLLDDSENTQKISHDDERIKIMTIPEVEHIANSRKYNL